MRHHTPVRVLAKSSMRFTHHWGSFDLVATATIGIVFLQSTAWKRISFIGAPTHPHSPPKVSTSWSTPLTRLTHWWVTCWCHLWRHHYHVICLRQCHAITDIICLHQHPSGTDITIDLWLPWLTIDRHLWPLTFCRPGTPYPVFHVDFIFTYFFSKWRIRTSLLLVAMIVANNPANVFAIFANVLATILRFAIIATNQLFPFLLLLLLTLRISNQWLLSMHSLSL